MCSGVVAGFAVLTAWPTLDGAVTFTGGNVACSLGVGWGPLN